MKKEISRGSRKGTKAIGSMQVYLEILYREMRDIMNDLDLFVATKVLLLLRQVANLPSPSGEMGNGEPGMISPTWVGVMKTFHVVSGCERHPFQNHPFQSSFTR